MVMSEDNIRELMRDKIARFHYTKSSNLAYATVIALARLNGGFIDITVTALNLIALCAITELGEEVELK